MSNFVAGDSGKDDDCLRMSIACYLDKPWQEINYISPDDPKFWLMWGAYLQNVYQKCLINSSNYEKVSRYLNSDKKWIAVVPQLGHSSKSGQHHAIVMEGSKIYYDCSPQPRKNKPKVIHYVIELVDA